MNASGLLIKYLIKSDGTVVTPNTTPNSLADNKGIFETGENVEIQFKNIGGQVSPIRKVIRGGSRIEPILYSQFESAPNSQWNTTMSFTDIIPSNTEIIDNYTATFTKSPSQLIQANTLTKITFNNALFGPSYFSNIDDSYVVPIEAVNDGINLIFQPSVEINISKIIFDEDYDLNIDVTVKLFKNGSFIGSYPTKDTTLLDGTPSIILNLSDSTLPPITLPPSSYNTGDKFSLHIEFTSNQPALTIFGVTENTQFNIKQYPIFISPITSSGVNSIWGWPDKTNYPNIITSSNPTLGNPEIYGNPNVRAVDITGSGFNTIQLPWSIEYGDEFRFEGREDFTYQVGKVFKPSDSGSGRLFQTGSIEVHFNNPLPVSASSSTFNLDHFLIRRYVDDATTAIIEGFKPTNSNGPYIIKPEFVVPELDKSIDEFILDLTQKGLIT